MLVEKAVNIEDRDIIRHDNKSIFLRPSVVFARVDKAKPPIRQPRKKELAGKPLRSEPAHCRPHSDMIDMCELKSQDHVWLGKVQRSGDELQTELTQCHVGCESVKTVMNVCWASKTQANETKAAWRNCAHPKLPMQCSIVSSSDFGGGSFDSSDELESERRGRVESTI